MSDITGLFTAVRGTNIAMTVSRVITHSVDEDVIECIYSVNGELRHFSASVSSFIGFGDELLFRDGAFVEAYNTTTIGEEEDDDEEEEEEDEDDDNTPGGPADHKDLRN